MGTQLLTWLHYSTWWKYKVFLWWKCKLCVKYSRLGIKFPEFVWLINQPFYSISKIYYTVENPLKILYFNCISQTISSNEMINLDSFLIFNANYFSILSLLLFSLISSFELFCTHLSLFSIFNCISCIKHKLVNIEWFLLLLPYFFLCMWHLKINILNIYYPLEP